MSICAACQKPVGERRGITIRLDETSDASKPVSFHTVCAIRLANTLLIEAQRAQAEADFQRWKSNRAGGRVDGPDTEN